MAGASVEITVDAKGLVRSGEELLARLEKASQLDEMLDEIGAALVSSTLTRFEEGRGPDDVAWAPSQRALDDGGVTLVDRGHLRASITHSVGRRRVDVGSNLVYAAIHQFGGPTGRNLAVDMPARPYLGIDAGDRAEIQGIVQDFLRGALE